MNSRELLWAIGDIDEDLVAEAAKSPPRTSPLRWVAAVAACLAVIGASAGSVWAYQQYSPHAQLSSVVSPTENASCNNASSSACWIYTPPMTITELAEKSTYIVCADVVEKRYEPTENFTKCFFVLKLRTVLKGSLKAGDEILYSDNGSIIPYEHGPKGRTLCGGPLLEKGNRVILFMIDSDSEFFTIEGETTYRYADGSLSKFFLDTDGKYHASATYSEWYHKYGHPDMPHQLTDYTPKTYDEMAALINAAE